MAATVHYIDFDKLLEQIVKPPIAIEASAANEREITGSELVAILAAAGAGGVVGHDEITGEINSVSARVGISLEAAGVAPAKLLGDLAQTSVGVSGSETQVIGLAEWTIDWKRKTADATTTDDDTYESSLASTASWSVKAKYMFIDGDPSQSSAIIAAITAPQAAQQWNFFPTIATGRAAFSGLAYIESITLASGMGKVLAMDVGLKGTGQLKVLAQIAPNQNPNTGTGQTAED